MHRRANKLETATVFGGFDSQDNAEEAVLALRIAGIPDDRIGYLARNGENGVTDLLARRHRFAATILGGTIGALLGWFIGPPFTRLWAGWDPHVDAIGMAATCAVMGSLLLGSFGGWLGLWSERPQPTGAVPGMEADPYVLAVDAREASNEVREAILVHGGHEVAYRPAA